MNADELVSSTEQALIGGVLWEGGEEIRPLLRAEEFFEERHRRLWIHLGSGGDFSLEGVLDRLRQAGELEAVGGLAYVAQCFEAGGLAVPSRLRVYAEAIRAAATSREMRAFGTVLAARGATVAEVEEKLSELRGLTGFTPAALPQFVDLTARWGKPGVTLGIRPLDRLIGGFAPGDLVVVGARPSHGKTALAVSWAVRCLLAAPPVPVSYVTLETPSLGLYRRLIAAQARLRIADLRRGSLSATEYELAEQSAGWLNTAPLRLRDMQDVGKDAGRVLLALAAEPAAVLILDHVQEVVTGWENRAQQLAWVCSRLKEIAVRRGCVLAVLAQLGRSADEHPTPRLSDLKDSGGLEERADVVLLLHYPVKSDAKADPCVLDVYVAKNRDGCTGKVTLTFRPEWGWVEAPSKEEPPWIHE